MTPLVMEWVTNPWIWIAVSAAFALAEFALGTGHALGVAVGTLACALMAAGIDSRAAQPVLWGCTPIGALVGVALLKRKDPASAAAATVFGGTTTGIGVVAAPTMEVAGWLLSAVTLALLGAWVAGRITSEHFSTQGNLNRYARKEGGPQ